MPDQTIPELWEWAEYYCPWSYIAAVRLYHVYPEYEGRVRLRVRPFPLEIMGGEAAPRAILEQEWWLAAIQEPRAAFDPWHGETWPTTTLPAALATASAATLMPPLVVADAVPTPPLKPAVVAPMPPPTLPSAKTPSLAAAAAA